MAVVDRAAAAAAIDAFLRAIGRDSSNEPELRGTGARVADAYVDELCEGYAIDVAKLLRENVVAGTTSLVVVRGIAMTTMCPHHLLPAFGHADVAFAPREKLVGLGTVGRLVDAYARRLALQEAIGEDVVASLMQHLAPRWAACRIVLAHGCMTMRGERKHDARVTSLALRGDVDESTVFTVLGASS